MAQAVPIGLAVAGKVAEGGTSLIGAGAESRQLKSQAKQLKRNAGLSRASGQRSAIDTRREIDVVQSRALALAAASGADASDPTIINNIARLEGEGEYRAITALYNSEQEALVQQDEARSRLKEAKNVKKAGLIKFGSSLISAGSTLAGRYG